jgi:signal peptidase I
VALLLFAALLVAFWPIRFLRFYAGFLILYSAWIALYVYAVCAAQSARLLPRAERPSRWWLVATLPLTFLTLSLIGGMLTRASGFRSFTIPSTSMEKTLRQGDHFVVDTNARIPEHREVIVFFRDRTYFVKRAIAINGDSIEGKHGLVYVNGKEQDEPYVQHTGKNNLDWLRNFGPLTIPSGKCFVMGDNRDVSLDSRSAEFGLVDYSSIIGKPLYVFDSDRAGKSIR